MLLGGYEWRSGRVRHQTQARKNSDSFVEFIEHVMATVPPEQKMIMVLDNAFYHRGMAIPALVPYLLPLSQGD
jgi:hypothetical protein